MSSSGAIVSASPGAIVTKRAPEASAFLPFLGIDFVQSLIFRRNEVGVLHAEPIVDHAIWDGLIVFGHDLKRMAGLRVVNIVPKNCRLIARDNFSDLSVRILSIGLALRLHLLVVSRDADGSGNECPVVSARIVKSHPQTLLIDGRGEFAD